MVLTGECMVSDYDSNGDKCIGTFPASQALKLEKKKMFSIQTG